MTFNLNFERQVEVNREGERRRAFRKEWQLPGTELFAEKHTPRPHPEGKKAEEGLRVRASECFALPRCSGLILSAVEAAEGFMKGSIV